jgi:hypothetical protein
MHADCQVTRVTVANMTADGPFLFQKIFDASGKVVREIEMAFNSLTQLSMYHFMLKEKNNRLLFIDKNNPSDTTIRVAFNSSGRPERAWTSSTLYNIETRFTYRNNRLDSIIRITFGNPNGQKCTYDAYGNILSILYYEASVGEFSGSFYTYDYSRKIKHQYYQDEIGRDHAFVALQYLDLFPELNPKHARTRIRVGLETIAAIQDNPLTQHQQDDGGRLVHYYAGLTADPQKLVTVTWNCDKKKNKGHGHD